MRTSDFVFPGADQLMPLETPPLRVSRPVAACQRCRQAKVKCDGKLPACTACEKSGRADQCSSTNDQFAKGKERSYVATLEAKFERLQKKIQEAQSRRKSSLVMQDAISPISRKVSIDSTGKIKDPKARYRKELSDIDELVSDFGFLTVNATARDFDHGFTFAMSYAKLVLAASVKEPLPTGMKQELPPKSTALGLIRLYIDNFLSLLPILDEPRIYGSMNLAYDEPAKVSFLDHWILRMVLAISSASLSQQRGDTYCFDATGHICAALEAADKVLHPGSIWSIQAMLLLVQYSMLDPTHFDSWILLGAASRTAIDLGLHQDPSKSSNTRKKKLELRRRVHYSIYVLDRAISMAQTRAFSFSDDSSKVCLPFATKSTSPLATSPGGTIWSKTSPEMALALIKLRKIQSSWYTEFFQSGRTSLVDPYPKIWEAYQELTDWSKSLPDTTPANIRDLFELELLYSYVYLLSPSPRCPNINEHAQKLIFEQSITYAQKAVHLTSQISDIKNPSLFTFNDVLRVYMTGRHFVNALSINLDGILQPRPNEPSSSPAYIARFLDAEVDPLASVPTNVRPPQMPPPLPTPSESSLAGNESPAGRAIEAINSFTSILSYFSQRFGLVGGINWGDRFQKESLQLLARLQQVLQIQQSSNDPSNCLWANGPVTPQNLPNLSPRASASFYPSPAATQYSPNYQPLERDASFTTAWGSFSSRADSNGLPIAITSSTSNNRGSGSVLGSIGTDESGIGSMAAWETLPGGSMNQRLSFS